MSRSTAHIQKGLGKREAVQQPLQKSLLLPVSPAANSLIPGFITGGSFRIGKRIMRSHPGEAFLPNYDAAARRKSRIRSIKTRIMCCWSESPRRQSFCINSRKETASISNTSISVRQRSVAV